MLLVYHFSVFYVIIGVHQIGGYGFRINRNNSVLETSKSNQTILDNSTFRRFGHDLNESFAHFVAVSFLLIIVVAAICNSVLITVVIYVPKLRSYMNLLIVNMAVSDLITALGTIPFDVQFLLKGYFDLGKVSCGIMHTTFLISLPSSMLCLLLLTTERLLTVVYAIRVQSIITKERLLLSVVIMWFYVFLVAIFPIVYDQDAVFVGNGMCFLVFPLGYQIYQVVANFFIPAVIIFSFNMVLLRISHRHANKGPRVANMLGMLYESQQNTEGKTLGKSITCFFLPLSFSRNIKAAKRIALLVGVVLICWLTYIILVVANYICVCHPREVTWIANIINYSSTAINPALYGLKDKIIMTELTKALQQFKSIFRTSSASRTDLKSSNAYELRPLNPSNR